jgi:squamous cell carcinoma antigen recognized by T-cells 3
MATEEEVPEAAAPAPAGGGGDDAMPDAASPSDSDSDSSDSDDEGAAGADELRIQALEQALQEQPLDYETHVQVPFALPLPRCHGALGF